MNARKTTDLERLTQPGGKVLPDDATIPVLTERLTLPSLELDISLPQPPPPVVAAPPAPAAAPPPVVAPANAPAAALITRPMTPRPAPQETARTDPAPVTAPASSASPAEMAAAPAVAPPTPASAPPPTPELDWNQVEERVRQALLRELQPRLAAELDRQLRERLQPTMVRMLLATVTELRPSIEAAVRDVIVRAVAAEIARQRGGR